MATNSTSLALRTFVAVAACALIVSCARAPAPGERVDLLPNDPRPVYGIQISDAAEIAILEQQLKIDAIRREGGTLLYFGSKEIDARLRTFGYDPVEVNPFQVFRRIVRVERRGSEKDIAAVAVTIINREDRYWVVEGTIASLRALERIGYRLSPVGANEPRTREVRIRVNSLTEVQTIGALHVDIYSVVEDKDGIIVYGGAYDRQIDRLQTEGFTVKRISTVP